MKTNDLLRECYERFVTPKIEEQVERTCKMMDDCEEIINNEYADVEIHKPSFYEGFKTGVNYVRDSNVLPIYIVTREMQFSNDILYATTNEQDAIEFFDAKCKFVSNRICYCLYEIFETNQTIIKVK